MQSFRSFLREHVLSIGLNPKHEPYREKYRGQIHSALRKSYAGIGGYGGLGSGSKEESDAIHSDISNHYIKAVRRGDDITAAHIYRKQHGRKVIAMGTDSSERGKTDIRRIAADDIKQKRSWGEVSGAPEKISRKLGAPVIPSDQAERLTGKKVKIIDKERYERKIGSHSHIKTMIGYPKD